MYLLPSFDLRGARQETDHGHGHAPSADHGQSRLNLTPLTLCTYTIAILEILAVEIIALVRPKRDLLISVLVNLPSVSLWTRLWRLSTNVSMPFTRIRITSNNIRETRFVICDVFGLRSAIHVWRFRWSVRSVDNILRLGLEALAPH